MNRKSRIAAVFALAGLLSACTSAGAFAGSPLLSGYGGPGAGEQAIIGSTLLGGPGGGAGSGRPGELQARGSGSAIEGSSSGSPAAAGPGPSHSGTSPSGKGRTKNVQGASHGLSHRDLGSAGEATQAFVYPPTLTSQKDDASAIEISQGDVLPLVGLLVTLGLVVALTVRVSRLQR